MLGIKAKAEQVGQLALPGGGHFNGHQQGQVFVQRQLLNGSASIRAIMIGNGRQTKLLAEQVVEQRLRRPAAITVGGMQLEINSRIGSETESSRGVVHKKTLY